MDYGRTNDEVQLGFLGCAIDDFARLEPTDSFGGGLPVWLLGKPPGDSLTR